MASDEAPAPPRLVEPLQLGSPPRLQEEVDVAALRSAAATPAPAAGLETQLAALSQEIKQLVSAGMAAAVAELKADLQRDLAPPPARAPRAEPKANTPMAMDKTYDPRTLEQGRYAQEMYTVVKTAYTLP